MARNGLVTVSDLNALAGCSARRRAQVLCCYLLNPNRYGVQEVARLVLRGYNDQAGQRVSLITRSCGFSAGNAGRYARAATERDVIRGMRLIEESVRQGYPKAVCHMARFYMNTLRAEGGLDTAAERLEEYGHGEEACEALVKEVREAQEQYRLEQERRTAENARWLEVGGRTVWVGVSTGFALKCAMAGRLCAVLGFPAGTVVWLGPEGTAYENP